MKSLYTLLSVVLLCTAFTVRGNHILGGHITYECLGGNNYGVTLTIYKDCFGATLAVPTENLFFIPNTGCTIPFSANIPLTGEVEISDLCASEIVNSSCSGGFIPGAQQLTYYGEVNLNPGCTWQIQWASGDWNYFINMDNSFLPTAFLATDLDPTTVGCASSIEIVTPNPINYSCTGAPVVYDIVVSNPNNYDLAFSLVCPLTTAGVTAPITAPCNDPIPGMTIDPNTGQIGFTSPMMFGNYVTAVSIDMFDNGDYVGTVTESIAFTIRLCTVTPTTFQAPLLQDVLNGTLAAVDEVTACVGDSVCVSVVGSNTNIFRTVTMTTDFGTVFPTGDFTTTGNNPVTGRFCVVATDAMVGSNLITVGIIDDACVNPSSAQDQFTVTISPGAFFGIPDTTICFGSTVEITGLGDTQFNWSVLSGDPAPGFVGNGPVQNLSPDTDTQIQIQSVNGVAGCPLTDVLNIFVSLAEVALVGTNESCAGNDGSIDLTVSGGSGNYTYDWPAIPSAVQDPNGLTGGNYEVTVTDAGLNFVCTRTESITLTSTPPPAGSISGDATICEGDCTDITFAFTGVGPFTVNLRNEQTGALEATGALNDGDTFQVCPTVTTTYTLELVTDANVPACTYAIETQVTITVRPSVTAGFVLPTAICGGESADLELSIDQPGNFVVTYTPNTGTPASPATATDGNLVAVTPAATTNYQVTSVEYTDAPACPGVVLAPVTLTVDPLPTLGVTAVATICEGDAVSLTLNLTGAGPWEVVHDYASAASPLVVNASPFTWNLPVSPAQSTTINFSSVTDVGAGCVAAVALISAINVNPLPGGSLANDATLCEDESADLTFTFTGIGPYTIQWSDGTTNFTNFGANTGLVQSVTPAQTTTYCLDLITDTNGCEFAPVSCVDITVIPAATAEFNGSSADICINDCADLAFTFSTGVGPYEVEYTVAGSSGSATTTAVFNAGDLLNLCPTESVTVTLNSVFDQGSNCAVDISTAQPFAINVAPISTIALSGSFALCVGECADLEFTVNDGTGPFDITLSGVNHTFTAADILNGVYTLQLCPVANAVYTLTAYTDQGNGCSAIAPGSQATVNVSAVPSAQFSAANVLLCEGQAGDVVLNLTPPGLPLDVVIEEDINGTVTVITTNGALNGDLFVFSPSADAQYTLTSVTDPASLCASQPNALLDVQVNGTPQISLPDTLCTLNAASFQISFEITGGDPATYAVDVPGNLVPLVPGPGAVYTSDPLVPSDGAVFTVTDGFNCGSVVLQIDPFQCPSNTFAGTVDTTPLLICEDGVVSTTQNGDEVLDPDDVLSYIIHSSPNESLGIVYFVSDQPSWNAADLDFGNTLQYGTTYYLSAVAGDDDGSGIVNLGAPNVHVSFGMPFTVLETPSAALSGDATLCFGESTDLQVDFAGSGPYTIAIENNGVPILGSPFTLVTDNPFLINVNQAGNYLITAVSNEACPGTTSGAADITINSLPTAVLTGGGLVCDGDSFDLDVALTGTADWDVTFGQDTDGDGIADATETVTFAQATGVYSVTQSGNYSVISVTDATGCVGQGDAAALPAVVEVVPLPDAEFVTQDTDFCAGTTVDITVELTAGTAPWTLDYGVGGGPNTAQIAATPFTFQAGVGGSVCLSTLTDANGCVANINECIELTEIPLPIADAGAGATVCTDDTFVLGAAAQPNYTYTWSPTDHLDDAQAAQPVFTAPAVNVAETFTYNVLVEANGCSAEDEVTLTVNPLPTADAGPAGFICAGDQFGLSASGGVDYLWTDDGSFVDPITTANPNVAPGITAVYEVTVTDANGCTAIATTTVTVQDALAAVVDFTPELCFGVCNGSISVTPAGGYGGYSIAWDQGLDGNTQQSDLCEGDYTYTLTDSEGCSLSETISIVELPEYTLVDAIATPTPCSGSSDGQIEVVSPEAVSFTIDPAGGSNATGVFSGLPAGDYTVTAINPAGCEASVQLVITELSAPITMEVGFEILTVCVGDVVDLTALAQGGDGNFTYTWFAQPDPLGVLSTSNPYTVAVNAGFTSYVRAVDGNGCFSEVLSSTVGFEDPINVELTNVPAESICFGECVTFEVSASGGVGGYSYEWMSNEAGGTALGSSPNLTDCPEEVITSLEYTLTVEDGCVEPFVLTAFVEVLSIPTPLFGFDVSEGCWPLTVEFQNLSDTLFMGSCVWDFGDGNTLASCDTVLHVYQDPGAFTPSLSVTHINGCEVTAPLDGTIDVHDYPVADFIWEPDSLTTIQPVASFINQSSDDAILFEWDFVGVGQSTDFEPTVIFPGIDGTDWVACLRVENIHGCPDTVCKEIQMISEVLVYVPSAFTPDNDGINEVFRPVIGGGVLAENYEFSIWNRWGEQVFVTNDPTEAWTGSVQRGDYYVQIDAYIWKLKYREVETGNDRELEGHVVVIR